DPAAQRTMVLDGVGGHVHERGERWGFLDWDYPGLRSAVHVDGVVNSRTRTDRGWTAELALPWKGLVDLADGRALPPKDGDVWRIDCSRFECIGRNGEFLNPGVGWTWNRRALRFPHPGSVSVRDIFGCAGADEASIVALRTTRQEGFLSAARHSTLSFRSGRGRWFFRRSRS